MQAHPRRRRKIKNALVSTEDLDVLPLALGEGAMRTLDMSSPVGSMKPIGRVKPSFPKKLSREFLLVR